MAVWEEFKDTDIELSDLADSEISEMLSSLKQSEVNEILAEMNLEIQALRERKQAISLALKIAQIVLTRGVVLI